MKDDAIKKDPNITRRNFLKKLTMTTVFTIPTIHSYNLLAGKPGKNEWTAHGHGNNYMPPPPPPTTTTG